MRWNRKKRLKYRPAPKKPEPTPVENSNQIEGVEYTELSERVRAALTRILKEKAAEVEKK